MHFLIWLNLCLTRTKARRSEQQKIKTEEEDILKLSRNSGTELEDGVSPKEARKERDDI